MKRAKPLIAGSIGMGALSAFILLNTFQIGYYEPDILPLYTAGFIVLTISFLLAIGVITWCCLQSADAESDDARPSPALRRLFLAEGIACLLGSLLIAVTWLLSINGEVSPY